MRRVIPLSPWFSMYHAFYGCKKLNQLVYEWNVSSVTHMGDAFQKCHAFDKDLSGWDVSRVRNMSRMFADCFAFDRSLAGRNVENVTSMAEMFSNCRKFNGALTGWNAVCVTVMSYMFRNCFLFNPPLSSWTVDEVLHMNGMLEGCYAFDQDLSSWNLLKPACLVIDFTGLIVENYFGILVTWAAKRTTLARNVVVHADGLRFNEAGAAALLSLETDNAWQLINDKSEVTPIGKPFITWWNARRGGAVPIPLVGKYSYTWTNLNDGTEVTGTADVGHGETLPLFYRHRGNR